MKLNEKLFILRKRFGFSQEELAYKLNVSRQTVSKWETDVMKPEIEKIVMLSKLFCLSTDVLLLEEVEIPNLMENQIEEKNEELEAKDKNGKSEKPMVLRNHKKNYMLITGIILSVISLTCIIAITIITLFSATAGDVTVVYITMYLSVKAIFILFVVLLIVAIGLIIYGSLIKNKTKNN